MKNRIFGRLVGFTCEMILLSEGNGKVYVAENIDHRTAAAVAINSVRKVVQKLRDSYYEGFVEFEGDPWRYEFSPDEDFAYPVVIDSVAEARNWREAEGYIDRPGYVVLVDSEVEGWATDLNHPEHWPSASIAVDENGWSWTAIGGNEHDGAVMWLPNVRIPD